MGDEKRYEYCLPEPGEWKISLTKDGITNTYTFEYIDGDGLWLQRATGVSILICPYHPEVIVDEADGANNDPQNN